MATAEDEEVIEQLAASGAHPPFRDRIRPWGPEGESDHVHVFEPKDLIKTGRVLGIPVAE